MNANNADLITIRPRQESPATSLRKARLAKRFSQADLAVVSGVSVSWVSMLERKPELMSPTVAERLARALGVPASELLPEAPAVSATAASGDQGAGVCPDASPALAGEHPDEGAR